MEGTYRLFKGSVVKILSCSECNVKCKHCYISFSGSFNDNELYEVVTKLSKKYEVRINGTEPLLHDGYLKSIEKANQTLVLTNGLVFKDNLDYLDKLKSFGIKTIGISYHFEWHNQISKVDQKFLENLFKIIISKGLEVQIMTTITSKNYKNVSDYCKYCEINNIRRIRFTNFMLQGRATELEKELILSDEQLKEFLLMIKELRHDYNKDKLDIQRCGSFGPLENSNFECTSGSDSVVLTPDYKVYPCLFMAKSGNEIGYYENGEIYINKEFKNDSKECKALKLYNRIFSDITT